MDIVAATAANHPIASHSPAQKLSQDHGTAQNLSPAPTHSKSKKIKLAACITWDLAEFDAVPFRGDFVHHAKKSADIGFDGIELAIRDPLVIDINSILSTLQSHNLELCAIGTGQAWGEDGLSFTHKDKAIRSQAVQRIKSHFTLASQTNALIIIGLLRGQSHKGVDPVQASKWMYDCFAECCEAAEKKDIAIAFEPINRYETSFINTIDEGLELIHKINAAKLGLLIDTFHMNIEEADISQSIKNAGSAVFHVHYADSNRHYPGRGHINFDAIIRSLYEIGYDKYLSGEHRAIPDPKTAVQEGYKYMSSLLNSLNPANSENSTHAINTHKEHTSKEVL